MTGLALLGGCAIGPSIMPIPGGEGDIIPIVGTVVLPPGSPLKPSDLQVISAVDSATPNRAGSVALNILNASTQLIVLTTKSGAVALLGYIFVGQRPDIRVSATDLKGFLVLPHSAQTPLGQPVQLQGGSTGFSAHSTALALVMLSPLLIGSPSHIRQQFATRALANAKFSTLESAIETALIQDPEHVLDPSVHPEIYQLAAHISEEVFQQITATAASTPLSSASANGFPNKPEHIEKPNPDRVFGDPQPLVEDSSETDIILRNPKQIWYGFKSREHDTKIAVGSGVLSTRSFWDFLFNVGPVREVFD